MKNIAVFASGSGTNFEAIVKSLRDSNINVSILICDKECFAIERAKNLGIKYSYVNPKCFNGKPDYEKHIINILKDLDIDLICLAGYMRYIGDDLLNAYPNKIINIHPALLPSFKGAHGISDAFNFGAKVMGVTVHYVDNGVDTGKIIDQDSFHVEANDTLETVEEKIHAIEHKLYPMVIKHILED